MLDFTNPDEEQQAGIGPGMGAMPVANTSSAPPVVAAPNMGGAEQSYPGIAAPMSQTPPEIAQAAQALQQANQFLGSVNGGMPAGPPGAVAGQPPPAAAAPSPGIQLPQVSATPALPTGGTSSQQDQAIRQAQIGNINAGAQTDAMEQANAVAKANGGVGVAQTLADTAQQQAANQRQQQVEREKVANMQAAKVAEAKKASDDAANAYAQAKPQDWFQDAPTGQRIGVLLGIALGNIADQINHGRGIQSNIGSQALDLMHSQIAGFEAADKGRIEQLHKVAVERGANLAEANQVRAAALSQVDDKYAGINQGLLLQTKAKLAEMGVDAAKQDGIQMVLDLQKKAQESNAKRLDSVNTFVQHDMTLDATMAEKAAALAAQKARHAGGGTGPGGKPLTAAQQAKQDQQDSALTIMDLQGQPVGKARTVKEAQNVRTGQEAATGLIDTINDMRDFVKREGTVQVPLFEGSARKEKEAIVSRAGGYLTQMRKTGILSPGEYERYASIMTPAIFASPDNADRALDQLTKSTADAYNRAVGAQLGAQGSTEQVKQQGPANRILPAGAEARTYKGVDGYRTPQGTAPNGSTIWKFTPWDSQ